MGRQAVVVLYVLAMVAVVVGVDVLFFRDEPGDLAGRDREAEVVYRQDRPVALGEMTNLDHRAGTLGRTRLAAGAAGGHQACGLSRCFCHFSLSLPGRRIIGGKLPGSRDRRKDTPILAVGQTFRS